MDVNGRDGREISRQEKRVAILQSNYIPWKGYFDIINMVDVFIFLDDVQYTKGAWRNRNLIKTPRGPRWLTIPCGPDEKRLICEVALNDSRWQRQHWDVLHTNYRKAPYFEYYRDFFAEVYLGRIWQNLSDLNQHLIMKIATEILGTATVFDDSRRYHLESKKADRVMELLVKCGATTYLSGPAAKSYLSEEMLAKVGVRLEWMDYSNYPPYEQLYPPFSHQVSIVDLLFNTGPQACAYMLSFAGKASNAALRSSVAETNSLRTQ